jgi:hypothetical protein
MGDWPPTRGFTGDHGPAVMAELNDPSALAVDTKGDVFIADTSNNRIREVNPSGIITTFAGSGKCGDRAQDGGPATNASICSPMGVAVDGTSVWGHAGFADRASGGHPARRLHRR